MYMIYAKKRQYLFNEDILTKTGRQATVVLRYETQISLRQEIFNFPLNVRRFCSPDRNLESRD